ncbi:MAG: PEP-CTERM sorting domain-containing protein [Armatimonadetes bacterium]|nr:PEP-CTERM sorting domain-containing protein [Armatimonadota bacterium]
MFFKRLFSVCSLVSVVVSAQAQIAVSLANDFSISNGNPNGAWAYQDDSTYLSVQIPLNNGNPLYPAVSNGYWGLGNNLNTDTPDLFKAQVSGSSAGETDLDFLAGDIVGHSPNNGTYLYERWIAPSNGSISNLSMLVWYAHSVVNRSSDYVLLDNATSLTSGTASKGNSDRSNAFSYNNAGFSVVAGDVISFGIRKSPGQDFGSLIGESLDFTFTPTAVPEPASMACLGLGVAALIRKRRATK